MDESAITEPALLPEATKFKELFGTLHICLSDATIFPA
jgi:hypothetical protein